ncbi:MAG: hypothetical protein RIC18_16495 [Hoeflea sp.]|uniref:hypothetical protein n=1 Tax=Hoeflea sp. TaxID=1940281 RepID=UPI0032EA9048
MIKRARSVLPETPLEDDAHGEVGNRDRGRRRRCCQVAGKRRAQGGEADRECRQHMRSRIEQLGQRFFELLL